ncbi:hypothetical protein C8Q79DRAFT_215425 [Trametes meyenii]|nr:hypothetical protein C8Q79DRAFT_215425 [Trametes meyenii]
MSTSGLLRWETANLATVDYQIGRCSNQKWLMFRSNPSVPTTLLQHSPHWQSLSELGTSLQLYPCGKATVTLEKFRGYQYPFQDATFILHSLGPGEACGGPDGESGVVVRVLRVGVVKEVNPETVIDFIKVDGIEPRSFRSRRDIPSALRPPCMPQNEGKTPGLGAPESVLKPKPTPPRTPIAKSKTSAHMPEHQLKRFEHRKVGETRVPPMASMAPRSSAMVPGLQNIGTRPGVLRHRQHQRDGERV